MNSSKFIENVILRNIYMKLFTYWHKLSSIKNERNAKKIVAKAYKNKKRNNFIL